MTTTGPEPVIVINDGTLPALVASLMARCVEDVIAFIPHGAPADVVRRQAEALGYAAIIESDDGEDPSAMLLGATRTAGARNVMAVVWPIHHGTDLDALHETAHRVALVNGLAALDWAGSASAGLQGCVAPEIVIPLADLGITEIAELAVDLDAPIDLARSLPEFTVAIEAVRRDWTLAPDNRAAGAA